MREWPRLTRIILKDAETRRVSQTQRWSMEDWVKKRFHHAGRFSLSTTFKPPVRWLGYCCEIV